MANSFLERLRLQNIFGQPQTPIGNDLPSQGGITGGMNRRTPFPLPGSSEFDIFNPPQEQFPSMEFGSSAGVGATAPQTPDFDYNQRWNELYQPETAANERFTGMMDQYPQREKPGFWRTAASILSALGPGGHEMGMQVAEHPFRQKLEDWKTKIGPAQQAANLERYENVNRRAMAGQQISGELRGREIQRKEESDKQNIAIRQQRADVYRFKAEHPGMKITSPKGGFLQAINPQTGQATLVTGSDGLPIATGSITDEDRLEFERDTRYGAISRTGAEQRETEDVRQGGRESLAETRGWETANIPDPSDPSRTIGVKINKITGEVKRISLDDQDVGPIARPSGRGGAESEQQKKIREYRAARQLQITRPDLAPFIKLGKNNEFRVTAQDIKVRKQIEEGIYGGGITGPTSGRTGGQQPLAKPPQAPPGYKYVRKPGGGWTAVEE